MQQPPYPYPGYHPNGLNPPPYPTKKPRKLPMIVILLIAVPVIIGAIGVIGTIVSLFEREETRFIEAKPTVTATELIWVDEKAQMSDTITQRVFETQGLLQLEYSCLFDSDEGNDVTINISLLDPEVLDTTVLVKRLQCPTSGSASVSLESGKYMLTVYSFGESGWSLKMYQSL